MQVDNGFQKDLNRYISDIKSKLLYGSNASKSCLEDLKNEIDAYVDEQGVTSMEDVYARFGTADEVASALNSTADVQTVKKKLNFKKLIAVMVAVFLAAWAIVCIYSAISANKGKVIFISESAVTEESSHLTDTATEV